MSHAALGGIFCALLLLSGCGDSSFHDTWKSTRGLYYEYLNPPASIDFDDEGDLNQSQTLLARNMGPIDQELLRFERFMMNQDKPPTPESVDMLFRRFRWINGAVAISTTGEVLAQEPPASLKQLDFSILLDPEKEQTRGVRAAVQDTPLGPEVLVGIPVFASSEMQGLYIAHFDMQALVANVPNPESLIVFTPDMMLWSGTHAGGAGPLGGQDWKKTLKSSTSGSTGQYIWVCRYIGDMPLIFASPRMGSGAVLSPAEKRTQEGNTSPSAQMIEEEIIIEEE